MSSERVLTARAPDLAAAHLADVALRTTGVAKAFGPTIALRSCSFDLRRGEVHAVLGENGSGKSTLVKALNGVHRPDRGTIELGGVEYREIRSPRAAAELGIATVFQEILVVPPRSVVENVWLGTEGFVRADRSPAEQRAGAAAVLEQLLGRVPPLGMPVEALSLSDRQACCIARALVRRPRILILDEATSALDVATRNRVFEILVRLRDEGVAVVFISHRMDEIEEIGDRITVMRSGDVVATVGRGEADATELVRLMTGSQHFTAQAADEAARVEPGPVVLRAAGLPLRLRAKPVDFEVRAGELVGVAGLEGHGQDAFLRALHGGGAFGGELVVQAGGKQTRIRSPRQAARAGVVYVPRERRLEGLFETLSVRENFALPTLAEDTVASTLLLPGRSERRLRQWVERLRIVLRGPREPVTTLSGGNQQKVVIARWLAAKPQVLLLNDPTRGVDIGAKRDIYELLVELAASGIAVVMLSTELDEHVELMHRVLVFREYELFAVLPRAELSRNRLVAAFFGRAGGDADGA